MKNEATIRKTLAENQEALKEYQDNPEESQEEYIYLGWVEALEYVLADEPVDPERQWAFNQIADHYAVNNYWHGTNGLYSYADDLEMTDDERDDDLDQGWFGYVNFGVQDDTGSSTNSFRVYIADKNYEIWKASNENMHARDVELLKWQEI